MARLIDADALKEELNSWAVDLTKSKFPHYVKDDADCIIDNAPTIDAVPRKDYEELERHFVNWEPVVRCRDCRWWENSKDSPFGYCLAMKHGYMSENWEIGIYRLYKGDFYCADAERKDDE